jgi:quercetin dioxygenase-like cupin family protein
VEDILSQLNVRRVVTGHSENGDAVIIQDDTIPGKVGDTGEAVLVWTTLTFPSDNNDVFDGALRDVRFVPLGGTALHFATIKPGKHTSHHRTLSLDYGIVLTGEIELELDNGVKTRCTAGDVIIQRGTIHTWRNPTDQLATIVFVLLDAVPVLVEGRRLDPTY